MAGMCVCVCVFFGYLFGLAGANFGETHHIFLLLLRCS